MYEFVRMHLAMDLPFELCDTSTTLSADKNEKALGELSLVPAALLRFQVSLALTIFASKTPFTVRR